MIYLQIAAVAHKEAIFQRLACRSLRLHVLVPYPVPATSDLTDLTLPVFWRYRTVSPLRPSLLIYTIGGVVWKNSFSFVKEVKRQVIYYSNWDIQVLRRMRISESFKHLYWTWKPIIVSNEWWRLKMVSLSDNRGSLSSPTAAAPRSSGDPSGQTLRARPWHNFCQELLFWFHCVTCWHFSWNRMKKCSFLLNYE